MLKLYKQSLKKLLSFSLLPLSILSLTSMLSKTPQHPKLNPFSQQSQTLTISENKTESLIQNKININAIDWNDKIYGWKGDYQEIKWYTEDHSLSKISSGWYEDIEGVNYFSYISVQFEKESEYKTIYFDIDNNQSLENVRSFTKKLLKIGTKQTKTIFGKEYQSIALDINADTTLRYQTDDRNNKFNNITPTMFGKGFSHDPKYVGTIGLYSQFNQNFVYFPDVLKQEVGNGDWYQQDRTAFSQDPSQGYELVDASNPVIGRDGTKYGDGSQGFPDMPAKTNSVRKEILSHSPDKVRDIGWTTIYYYYVSLQLDVWFIKGKWYASFYWNNNSPKENFTIGDKDHGWNEKGFPKSHEFIGIKSLYYKNYGVEDLPTLYLVNQNGDEGYYAANWLSETIKNWLEKEKQTHYFNPHYLTKVKVEVVLHWGFFEGYHSCVHNLYITQF